eukprot:TRINITY_DN3110_c0_g2_i1.p1 TRINITY_DN3110_c0_g2~~TRINITY_DN3110_c0_g2_i1.p1  ORF type:complete len:659 (-),score=124.87 TRINITY_DN3110_c0_g2_i1:104-2080(-)
MNTKCPVCLDSFDSVLSVPKCLDCGHTICRKCIVLASNSDRYNCPICRRPIGNKTADEMPTNYALIPEEQNVSSQNCSYIESEQYPEWRSEISGSRRSRMNMVCMQHNKPMSKMCSCGQAVCGPCLLSDKHKGHAAQGLDPMFFVPISIFTKEKLRAFAEENMSCYQAGTEFLNNVNDFWTAIRASNDETLKHFQDMNESVLNNDFMTICDSYHSLNKSDLDPLYQTLSYLEKDLGESTSKVLGCVKEIMEQCPEDRVTTSANATWLLRNATNLKASISEMCSLKHNLELLENRDLILPRPFSQDDIDLSVKSLYASDSGYQQENLLIRKSQGLSKTSPVLICWNRNVTHLLQNTLLCTFCFYSESFDTKELIINSSAQEYLELLRMGIVAAMHDDEVAYLVGGFNKQAQKETGSCFKVDSDRIVRISSLNSAKYSVSVLFLGNYVYCLGGCVTNESTIYKPLSDVERYCVALDVWVTLNFALTVPRYDAKSLAISDSQILICGGFSLNNKFITQMDIVTLSADIEGTVSSLPVLLKCSDTVKHFYAYYYNSKLCTIAGSQLVGVEEQKTHAKESECLFTLQHYSLDGSLVKDKILGRAKMGICQGMAESEGGVYEFWPKMSDKKGATWERPRVFSIDNGEEKPRSELAELMYIISST